MIDGFEARPALSENELEQIRELFREYQAWLNVDSCFQAFEEELDSLPATYHETGGQLLLLTETATGQAVGCIGLQNKGGGICEIKRLYVRDRWRGKGLGRGLAELCLKRARETGYEKMVLETVAFLTQARQLYGSMGFVETSLPDKGADSQIVAMEVRL